MALLKGIGKQIQIGVAVESTRGTAKTSATYWLPTDDSELEERFQNVIDGQTYGVIEDNFGQTRVKNWMEGQIVMPLTGTSAAVLFYSLFGTSAAVVHAGETRVFDNTMNVLQTAQHKSLTFFVHDPIPTANGATADYTHANGVVNKIDIDYSLGNWVMLTAGIKALAGSAAAVVFTPAIVSEPRFVPQYLTFKVASTASGLTAASAIKIKNAKITIDENIEDDEVLGQVAPRDFLNKEFMIEGTIEAIFQNETDFKASALANTPKAMRLDLVNSDVTIGVASTNPQVRLDLTKVYFTEFSRPIKIKDVVYQTIKFKAAYSASDGYMARLLWVNHVDIGNL